MFDDPPASTALVLPPALSGLPPLPSLPPLLVLIVEALLIAEPGEPPSATELPGSADVPSVPQPRTATLPERMVTHKFSIECSNAHFMVVFSSD